MQEMNGLGKFVMTIIVVAMVLTIGLIILGEFKTSIGDDIDATSVVNESVVFVNATNVALAHTGFTLSCSEVTNGTVGGTVVPTTDYTCSTKGIIVTAEAFNGTNGSIFVDYTYKVGDAAYNATGTNITKLATIPTWIGILITVALAFIVLGYFYSRNN